MIVEETKVVRISRRPSPMLSMTDQNKNNWRIWNVSTVRGGVITSEASILIKPNKMQQYAGIYLLQNHSTCFGCPSHPSSGVHQTVTAASGTGHSVKYESLN